MKNRPEYKSYADKLRDPRWQMKRLEIMKRDGAKCRECGDGTRPLNVHHHWYDKGKEPWDYPAKALLTLCEVCHKKLEKFKKDIQKWGPSSSEYLSLCAFMHSMRGGPRRDLHLAAMAAAFTALLAAHQDCVDGLGVAPKKALRAIRGLTAVVDDAFSRFNVKQGGDK